MLSDLCFLLGSILGLFLVEFSLALDLYFWHLDFDFGALEHGSALCFKYSSFCWEDGVLGDDSNMVDVCFIFSLTLAF